jgi:hypothetical protein
MNFANNSFAPKTVPSLPANIGIKPKALRRHEKTPIPVWLAYIFALSFSLYPISVKRLPGIAACLLLAEC